MTILIYCGIVLALCILQYPFSAWSLKRLQCSRALSRSTAFAGESGEMIETVGNHSPFMIPWLRLESHISPYLQLGKQESLQSLHNSFYTSLFTLMPYQQIRRTHQIRFLRRGVYDLGGAALTAGDILGIFRLGFTQEESPRILVFPRLLEADQVPALISQQLGELSRRRQLMEDPFLVRGIRAYQPGDPIRDIHWPATARMGEAQLRIHDYSARTRLLVVLNVQGEDMQWQDRLEQRLEQTMEYGISLAATVCVRALEAGLCAGFAANTATDDSRDTTLILPSDSGATQEMLLSTLARLKTTRHQHFPIFLKQLQVHSDLDILILSNYDNEEIRQARRDLENRGCQVTFYQLEGGAV